ncbi:MAG: NADH-quinone oxidoreductase subunit NuoE [Chloroflexi bacterium]|nr:NADH-quinone oxidoreductase subunit NuoE [Chloroflexota bacterium]
MLTKEERREIEAETRRYEQKQAASVEALKIVQRHRGWVSDEGVRDVAELLGMTTAEVDDVATFYSLIYRRPVGRHVILLCDSVSCYVVGYEQARDHLRRRLGVDLGGTSADGRFTLLPVACLGHCELAPAMMIDDDVYGDLGPDSIDAALAKYE